MRRVHVGRQPIYDRNRDVHGYELLFRASGEAVDAGLAPGDLATTQVIVNTFTEFGLDRLVGSKLAFVNVTRPFVVNTMPIPFTPEQAVLELLENVPADDAVLEGCAALVAEGYALALDDFAWEPERLALVPFCKYVKTDVLGLDHAGLAAALERTKEAGALAVAERIDDLEMLQHCADLGYDLFQGYALLRPDVASAQSVTPSHLACLQLMARLADPDIAVPDVEDIVRTDLALNYRVLRAANAASSGLRRRVESIRDALVLLGLQRLRSWLLLMVLADSGKPNEEQLSTAMTRARTCELVAGAVRGVRPESAFIVGVLSSLDLVLGLPMEAVVDRLPLADDLRAALVERSGSLGQILDAVLAYERGDDDAVAAAPFDPFELSRAYLSAVGWSLQVCESALHTA